MVEKNDAVVVGISAGSEETEPQPRVGHLVYHDGQRDFRLTKFGTISRNGAKTTHLAQFENERFRVSCLTGDLVYSEKRQAWYLRGRVFPREVRKDQRNSKLDPLEVEDHFMNWERTS